MSEPLTEAELAIHRAICEGSPEDCKDWRGRCVKAAEAVQPLIESADLPAEEDPATREWIAIPAAEATEQWAARSIEPDVTRTFAMDTRAEAEQFCEEWARFYGLKATVLHRFVGPWEPLEGEQDHA